MGEGGDGARTGLFGIPVSVFCQPFIESLSKMVSFSGETTSLHLSCRPCPVSAHFLSIPLFLSFCLDKARD